MVCIECRSIHEFFDLEIEIRQIEIAKNFGFELTDHKLNLYGICALCSKTQAG
jgi:Fur family ferric uptake transcriptional regulator